MRDARADGPARTIEEDLQILDVKLKQLKQAYDQYFLGSRPRLPHLLRREVDKLIVTYSNRAIQNTAMRFKFNSLCSRFNAYRRQWEENLRKIDAGTFAPHQFKANLRGRPGMASAPAPAASRGGNLESPELFDAYLEARRSCGQDVATLTPQKFQAVLRRQASVLREKTGGDVRFRVLVQDGKAVIKAAKL